MKTNKTTHHVVLQVGQGVDPWPDVLAPCFRIDRSLLRRPRCSTTYLGGGVVGEEVHRPQKVLDVPRPIIFVWKFVCLHEQRPGDDGHMDRCPEVVAEATILCSIRTEFLPGTALDFLGDTVEILDCRELTLTFGSWLLGVHVDRRRRSDFVGGRGEMSDLLGDWDATTR